MYQKYRNQKTMLDGILFDSKHEAEHWAWLKILERTGQITDLKRQVHFELQEGFKFKGRSYRPITYIADFVYYQNGQMVVEDAKGMRTEVYKIKKKLMLYKGIEIREV